MVDTSSIFAWLNSVPSLLFGQQEPGGTRSTTGYSLGVDLPEVLGTPIGNLLPGRVVTADYAPWGGQVDILTQLPNGGMGIEEYLHLDQIAVQVGQMVGQGSLVGTSGGQLSGGTHPANPQYSTGPHIKFSLFSGSQPYANAANAINPLPLLNQFKSLFNGGNGGSGGTGVGPLPVGFLPGINLPGIPAITDVNSFVRYLGTWVAGGRALKFILGIICVFFGILILIQPEIKQTATSALTLAGATAA